MDQSTTTKVKRVRKKWIDICYSISNVTLILTSIVSFILTAQQFFLDGPLYDFRHQLGLSRYYYCTFYILFVSLLVLAIPVYNALAVTKKYWKQSYRYSIFVLLVVLSIVAVQLISTTIRWSSMVIQFTEELHRHMERKYQNDFSLEFIDIIQSHFRCCDEQWYRANHLHTLPLTCYNSTALDMVIYKESCAQVLAGLVSLRSVILMVLLTLIVIGSSFLSAIDIIELFILSKRPKPKTQSNESREDATIKRSLLELDDQSNKVERAKV